MIYIVFLILIILLGLMALGVWAYVSIAEATRNKEPLQNGALYVKIALIASLVIYGLFLSVFLVKNTGSKRTISIESRTEHGVLIIKQVKYPTYFKSSQALIVYHVNNPIPYLFLNCDVFQICYTDALLRLAIVILAVIFMWRFNFDQPFQWEYYNSARRIWGLIALTIVLEIITNAYSSTWVRDTLTDPNVDGPRYQYTGGHSGVPLIMLLIVISSLFYMYGQAIRNREEIDLTI